MSCSVRSCHVIMMVKPSMAMGGFCRWAFGNLWAGTWAIPPPNLNCSAAVAAARYGLPTPSLRFRPSFWQRQCQLHHEIHRHYKKAWQGQFAKLIKR